MPFYHAQVCTHSCKHTYILTYSCESADWWYFWDGRCGYPRPSRLLTRPATNHSHTPTPHYRRRRSTSKRRSARTTSRTTRPSGRPSGGPTPAASTSIRTRTWSSTSSAPKLVQPRTPPRSLSTLGVGFGTGTRVGFSFGFVAVAGLLELRCDPVGAWVCVHALTGGGGVCMGRPLSFLR